MAEVYPPEVEGESLSWIDIWIKALTQPSEESYVEIINDPQASSKKANTWVFLAAFVAFVISILFGAVFSTDLYGGIGGLGFGWIFGTMICAGPVSGVFAVLGLIISSGIIQAIAKALGGEGEREQLVFVMAAYVAPISLISTFIGSIPYVSILGWVVSIYAFVLNVIAVKATNKFSWGKAIASSLGILLLIGVIAVAVIVILALIGPAIGNIYKNLQ